MVVPMRCDTSVSVILVGSGFVEHECTMSKPAAFARSRVYPYGKGHRIEVPHGALVPDDMLKPIVQDKRRMPKFRAAINEALRSAIGTVIKTVELPPPGRTPIAPPRPLKPMKPKVVKPPKPPRPVRIPTRGRTCGRCGQNLPAERFYAHANGSPVSVCKTCFSTKYTSKRKRKGHPLTANSNAMGQAQPGLGDLEPLHAVGG